MTSTAIPTVTGRLIHGGTGIAVTCPWCGRTHVHGVPPRDRGKAHLGHRASDCAGVVGYYVVASNTPTLDALTRANR